MTLDSVDKVTVDESAQTNTIAYAGEKPVIDDRGRNTTTQAKK